MAVPGDLSVIGFDDLPAARYTIPQLTTIAQPVRQIGEAAVAHLVELMRAKAVPPAPDLSLRLVARGTTAAVRP